MSANGLNYRRDIRTSALRHLAAGISISLLVFGSFGILLARHACATDDQSEERAFRQLHNIAVGAATLVNTYMDARATEVLACPASSDRLIAALLKTDARQEAKVLLGQWLNTYGAYDAMLLLDKNGVCVTAAPDGLENKDFSEDPSFKEALSGKLGFADAHKSETIERLDPQSKGWTVGIAAPIRIDNDVEGVLLSYLKWSRLGEVLLSVPVGQTGYAFMLNSKNQIILHPNRPLYGMRLADPPVRLASLDQAVRKRASYHAYEFLNPRTQRRDSKLVGLVYPNRYGRFPGLGWIVGATVDRNELLGEPSIWKRLFR